tara:strand:- start:723 stop:1187 length:465 start_codon:yes stop_codon:yes gene_type:complete
MKKSCLVTIAILAFTTFTAFGQNIYPEKLEGCNTEQFGLENDSIDAHKSNKFLSELIVKAIEKDVLQELRGILKIQVIAYSDGSSCMISYENATNKSEKAINILGIKKLIDKELVWDSVDKVVSPMIEFYFLYDTLKVKRMGFGGKKGWHEITD